MVLEIFRRLQRNRLKERGRETLLWLQIRITQNNHPKKITRPGILDLINNYTKKINKTV